MRPPAIRRGASPDNHAFANDYASDSRIRRGAAKLPARKSQRLAHEALIVLR
jgi:hypothetical protein